MAKKSTAFPVGLYGMLLFALLWLTLPAVFAPLERLLVGAVCIVPRVASRFFGEPAVAARRADLRRIDELGAVLHRRVERHDFAGAGMSMAAGAAPVLCSVLSVQRRGGAGLPSELLLDHSYRELAGCGEIVTKGPTLLGFLQRPGVGVAADDLPDDPARVLLCHHRRAPRLYAGLEQPDGSRLHFVVRSSASVDPAPLRVDLWDDPYRAAKLGRAGQQVFTLPLSFGEQRVPGGLLLGRTRIWGYEQPDSDEQLTIGVFVVPPIEPRALSHVVLWREHDVTPAIASSSLRARRRRSAIVYDLPGAVHGRHLLVAGERVPDGAAVVQNGLFLGSARGLAFGGGLVTSFVASRQSWSLLFLPDGTGELDAPSPVELHAAVVRSQDNVAWLRFRGPARAEPRLGPGYLFTGSNGRFCPAGLWIGRAEPHAFERDLLRVTVPPQAGPRLAEVIVEGEQP